jgi:hypothetical protein
MTRHIKNNLNITFLWGGERYFMGMVTYSKDRLMEFDRKVCGWIMEFSWYMHVKSEKIMKISIKAAKIPIEI